MAIAYSQFNTTPTNAVADIKAAILASADWANITGQIVKATTTRGAQMVVDLADAAATAIQLQLGVYRTHNGTTGVDKTVRYANWRTGGGATSDTLHVTVSAGKEHLFLLVEGPRGGETNAMDATVGSDKWPFFIGDIVPYFASDTTPAVLLVGNKTSASNGSTGQAAVSRDQGNLNSWVACKLATLAFNTDSNGSDGRGWGNPNRVAAGDGKVYMWPYVVIEDADGLRGRINKLFHIGSMFAGTDALDGPVSLYSRYSYGGDTYQVITSQRSSGGSGIVRTPFGGSHNSTGDTASPLIAIQIA